MGLASLMRPEGPLSDVPSARCRYAVARTKPRRSSRRYWPGGVMSSPFKVSRRGATERALMNRSVALPVHSVNPNRPARDESAVLGSAQRIGVSQRVASAPSS